jgi:ADP-glucose pyrophosphorylase
MKRMPVIIFVKKHEPGLLSIIDGGEKSFLPLLGGVRLIDLYLGPLIQNGFKQVTIIMDNEMTGAREYLLYGYSAQKLKVMDAKDIKRVLLSLLKQKRNERFLILRADGALLMNWYKFFELVSTLQDLNYELITGKDKRIGFLLCETGSVLKLIEEFSTDSEMTVDGSWVLFKDVLKTDYKPVHFEWRNFWLNTVKEYHNFHISLLRDEGSFIHILSLNPKENPEKENLAMVEGTGFVKDSYISSSCSVKGYVENSVLFPHVKIGSDARVINSVILSNNYIGEGAVVQNVVLCENGQLSKVIPNVGEGARIGEDDPSGANGQYPDYIFGGITLVGQNVEIPKGFRISRNCYVSSGVDRTLLKGRERVKAGDSVTIQH